MIERALYYLKDRYKPYLEDTQLRRQLNVLYPSQPAVAEAVATDSLRYLLERNSKNIQAIATCLQVIDSTSLPPSERRKLGLPEHILSADQSFYWDVPLQLLQPDSEAWRMSTLLCPKAEGLLVEAQKNANGHTSFVLIPNYFVVKFWEKIAGLAYQTFEGIDSETGRGTIYLSGVWYIARLPSSEQSQTFSYKELRQFSYNLQVPSKHISAEEEIRQSLFTYKWQSDRKFNGKKYTRSCK